MKEITAMTARRDSLAAGVLLAGRVLFVVIILTSGALLASCKDEAPKMAADPTADAGPRTAPPEEKTAEKPEHADAVSGENRVVVVYAINEVELQRVMAARGTEPLDVVRDELLEAAVATIRDRDATLTVQHVGAQIAVEGSADAISAALPGNDILSISQPLPARESSAAFGAKWMDASQSNPLVAFSNKDGTLRAISDSDATPCEVLRRFAAEQGGMGQRWMGFESTQGGMLSDTFPDAQDGCKLWLRKEPAVLSPMAIVHANVIWDEVRGEPAVIVELTDAHGGVLQSHTRDHVGEILLLAMGNRVLMAPMITGEIPGKNLRIDLGAGELPELERAANELVLNIRSASLPQPLIETSRTIIKPGTP